MAKSLSKFAFIVIMMHVAISKANNEGKNMLIEMIYNC